MTRALTRRHRYSSDTLFTDVTMLTERATATFTAAGLNIAYPPPAKHVTRARALRPGVDTTAALAHLLTDALRPWQDTGAALGLELSGGLDSGTVAIAARTTTSTPLRSFGIIVNGALGAEQHRRRVAIARQVDAVDDILRAHDHAPFCGHGIRASGGAHDPRGEFYREAFEALADRASRSGVEIMLTGNGGDEIMAPRVDELPPPPPQPLTEVSWLGPRAREAVTTIDDNLAPSAVLPTPTLMSFAIHHPAYLRSGIWPVAPLTHPPLIRFAEQLPLDLRRHKKLYRDFLTRAGLPAIVTHPRRTEPLPGPDATRPAAQRTPVGRAPTGRRNAPCRPRLHRPRRAPPHCAARPPERYRAVRAVRHPRPRSRPPITAGPNQRPGRMNLAAHNIAYRRPDLYDALTRGSTAAATC
ncbi:asparagine synthase-related protein, partial [Amycolatopsis keratiniphila]|uniref:asparagine synthase-related protein n=1 Tax=Amycolatopsis keratiniphila TaxID=129921 RepID=UPI0033D4FD95